MADPLLRPRLRLLDIRPCKNGDREGLLLADDLGLIDGRVFVPIELLPVLGRFTGEKTVEEIASELSEESGRPLPADFVRNLASQLEERLCLEGPRFEEALRARKRAFRALEARPAANAGSAGYPEDPVECRRALEEILDGVEDPEEELPEGPLRALVSPHIDLSRGARGYAAAYGPLRDRPPPDLVLVLGTGHQGPSSPLVPCSLDFETPLGLVRTDRRLVEELASRIPAEDPFDESLLHEREHSVEFQVLFLRACWPDHDFLLLPFLTGALPEDPEKDPGFRGMIEGFREILAADGRRLLLVAGADLAHRGPFFGEADPVSDSLLEEIRDQDRRDLALLKAGKTVEFAGSVLADGNPRQVCGTAPMFLAVELAKALDPRLRGGLLAYGQSLAQDRSQVVTWASMAFTGGGA